MILEDSFGPAVNSDEATKPKAVPIKMNKMNSDIPGKSKSRVAMETVLFPEPEQNIPESEAPRSNHEEIEAIEREASEILNDSQEELTERVSQSSIDKIEDGNRMDETRDNHFTPKSVQSGGELQRENSLDNVTNVDVSVDQISA